MRRMDLGGLEGIRDGLAVGVGKAGLPEGDSAFHFQLLEQLPAPALHGRRACASEPFD